MDSIITEPLTSEQLMRLNLQGNTDDYWSDIDGNISLCKLKEGGYQQIVYDDAGNELKIGVPLHTVGELQLRFKSLTGFDLQYWNKEHPQTAQ